MAAIKSLHELIEDLSKIVIDPDQSSDAFIDHYKVKGWSRNILETGQVFGTITFEDIFLPAADTSIQISSTNRFDDSAVQINGFSDKNSGFQPITATAVLNGRNAVSVSTPFYRIESIELTDPTKTNDGDIYITLNGAVLTNGAPTVATDYMYSMDNNDRKGHVLNCFIPPKEMYSFTEKKIYLNVTNETRNNVTIKLQYKRSDDAFWTTSYVVYQQRTTSGNSHANIDLSHNLYIDNSNPDQGMDYRIIAIPGASGNVSISAMIELDMVSSLL